MNRPRFHLAFPVRDLEEARAFYVGVLGCGEGRSDPAWIDFDFFGHQIVAHLSRTSESTETHDVDGEQVPVRHFGAILDRQMWDRMANTLHENGVAFIIPPTIRFEGKPGEQATMFFLDPSGNAIEFKAFADEAQIFARQ